MLRQLDRAILLPHGQHDEHQMDDHDKERRIQAGTTRLTVLVGSYRLGVEDL